MVLFLGFPIQPVQKAYPQKETTHTHTHAPGVPGLDTFCGHTLGLDRVIRHTRGAGLYTYWADPFSLSTAQAVLTLTLPGPSSQEVRPTHPSCSVATVFPTCWVGLPRDMVNGRSRQGYGRGMVQKGRIKHVNSWAFEGFVVNGAMCLCVCVCGKCLLTPVTLL